MTTPATIPTAVSAADPGAAVSRAAVAPMPKQDDRMLAAAAHLSFLAGLWLVAAIAIYVIKRKESHFVAYQALQSAVMHVLWAVSAMGSGFVFFVLMLIASASQNPAAAAIGVVAPFLLFGGGGLAILGVHVYAAYEAWCGRSWSVPIAGRIATAIMRGDEGAARA